MGLGEGGKRPNEREVRRMRQETIRHPKKTKPKEGGKKIGKHLEQTPAKNRLTDQRLRNNSMPLGRVHEP